MEGVNGGVIRKEVHDNRVVYSSSTNVDYHLRNLVVSHLSNPPELTPQEIADSSRAIAEAAASAAKAARATAVEKAAAASRAIAAAKTALQLIASFPKQSVKHVAASDLSSELPSKLQLAIISNSCSSCEDKNDQCEEEVLPNTEQAISNIADVNGTATPMEIRAETAGGEEGIQVARKRGRPKSRESKPSSAVS